MNVKYYCGRYPKKKCEFANLGGNDETICEGCKFSKNTLKQYFARGGKWMVECDASNAYRFMNVDIQFLNNEGMEDEVQFSIKSYDQRELCVLYENFCKEMKYPKNTVQGVYVVEVAEKMEDLS